MDWKMFFIVFGTVFMAELGDKTQLSTLVFSTQAKSPWIVFAASASALVLSSLIASVLGQGVARFIPGSMLKGVAGVSFIVIGFFMLLSLRK